MRRTRALLYPRIENGCVLAWGRRTLTLRMIPFSGMRETNELSERRGKLGKPLGEMRGGSLRIVYWQPFSELAFNHCAQSPY